MSEVPREEELVGHSADAANSFSTRRSQRSLLSVFGLVGTGTALSLD